VIDMKLQTNEAPLDRALRILLGIVLGAVTLAGAIVTPWLYAAWVVAAILVVTGIVGFCPLYAVLRVSTKSHAR
jgi:Inner membrane protein YgaP-like, transmembrane domain